MTSRPQPTKILTFWSHGDGTTRYRVAMSDGTQKVTKFRPESLPLPLYPWEREESAEDEPTEAELKAGEPGGGPASWLQ